MRCIILGLILASTSACTGVFHNKMNEMALICGEGYDSGKSYIVVTGSQQAENLGLISLPKDSTPLTAKGCLERPQAGDVFVTNLERTEGVWVTANSKDKVELIPLAPRKLPAACNSVVHGDGRGFTLRFDLDEKNREREMQTIGVQLKKMESREAIASWSPRTLEKTTAFDFDEARPLLAGEYLLVAEIKDELSAASSVSECSLRVDYSELLISPAESIKTRRTYNGQEVLLVQPGYNVNFYVHEGFRDVAIEYCLKRLKTSDVRPDMATEHLRCETTQDFLNTKSEGLDEGFWVLNYRGQRGLVQNAWQHAVFLVDKVCLGAFTSMKDFEGKACTTIRGSIKISDLTEENAALLDSVGVVFGNVAFERNRIKNLDVLNNLTQIFGNFSVDSNSSESLEGFRSLNQVMGDVLISHNNYIKILSGFDNLQVVSGSLEINFNVSIESITGFSSLKFIERNVALREVPIKNLSFLGSLELVDSLNLDGLTELESLGGLESLKKINKIFIKDVSSLTNLSGFKAVDIIDELNIRSMENLSKISDFAVKSIKNLMIYECPSLAFGGSEAVPIQIKSAMNITDVKLIQGLEEFTFSDEFRYLLIDSAQVLSMKGVESVAELKFLTLSNLT